MLSSGDTLSSVMSLENLVAMSAEKLVHATKQTSRTERNKPRALCTFTQTHDWLCPFQSTIPPTASLKCECESPLLDQVGF